MAHKLHYLRVLKTWTYIAVRFDCWLHAPCQLNFCVCSLAILEIKHVSIFPSKGKKASVDFTKELLPIWLEWLQPAVLPLWCMKMCHIFYLTLEKRRSEQKEDKSRTSAQGSNMLLCVWNVKLINKMGL